MYGIIKIPEVNRTTICTSYIFQNSAQSSCTEVPMPEMPNYSACGCEDVIIEESQVEKLRNVSTSILIKHLVCLSVCVCVSYRFSKPPKVPLS